MAKKKDDLLIIWGKDNDLLRLFSYFKEDDLFGCPCHDLIMWLYPQYESIAKGKDRKHYEWLCKQKYNKESLRDNPKWWEEKIPLLLNLIENIAIQNNVNTAPSNYVFTEIRNAVSPWFNQNPQECITFLRKKLSNCNFSPLRSLLKSLIKHYDDVLKFMKELNDIYDNE